MISRSQILKDLIYHAKELGTVNLILCKTKLDREKTNGRGIS